MEKLSRAQEDYLEAIAMLGGTIDEPVRSVDVATNLKVSKAFVSKTLQELKERGLLKQERYGEITFTEEGYELGKLVLERHQLLFRFLTEELGVPRERANEEACMMEHAISDESFKLWIEYLKRLD